MNMMNSSEENLGIAGVADLSKELQDLLDGFRDVFRNELPDELPPRRGVDHAIDTGNERPVNRNAYQLSVQQLDEQARQIEKLGLIQEE